MDKQAENQNASSPFLGGDGGKTKSNTIEVPSISLPKDGGTIKSIGVKQKIDSGLSKYFNNIEIQ